MDEKTYEYLKKTAEESKKKAFTKEENEKIAEIFYANLDYSPDSAVVVSFTEQIVESQYLDFDQDTLFNELTSKIIEHGPLVGVVDAVERAKNLELMRAAKLIDAGRYDDFEEMKKKGFYEMRDFSLLDYVTTLSGAEYLEKQNLIPEGYFTDSRKDFPVLSKASSEQIDFYIAHGADVNASPYDCCSLLDWMIIRGDSVDDVKKVFDAGGRSYKSTAQLLNEIINDEGVLNCSKEYVGNVLNCVAFLLSRKEKVSKNFFNKLSQKEELFERYPELMGKIMAYDKDGDPLEIKMKQIRGILDGRHLRMGKTSDNTKEDYREVIADVRKFVISKRVNECKE